MPALPVRRRGRPSSGGAGGWICRSRIARKTPRPSTPSSRRRTSPRPRERDQYVTLTPEFQPRLVQANTDNLASLAEIAANDPERNFTGNVCANNGQECAGDVRFYDWEDAGFGIVEPVLFTARNGSTISGRVWATKSGPEKRPLIVITNGSVQAPEQLYWGQAATLAKHGYVVLTYDPQGQGRSDTFGEGADQSDGFPSQTGRPFYDNTEDALDFALSTPSEPYDPRPSCTSGTDHSPKQDRRVAAGLNAAYNPLADLVDPSRVGIAGHSLGAAAVSYIGQIDPRVDAIVAWDNLGAHASRRARPPARPAPPRARLPADDQAGPRDLERLRDRADAEHLGPGPAGGQQRLPRLQGRRRRLAAVPHPRRHPRGVGVHPRDDGPAPRAREPARLGPDRLVLDRVVRQAGQVRRRLRVRGRRRQAHPHRPLAQRRAQRPDRRELRPERLLVLQALPLRPADRRRRGGRLRRHAHRLRVDGPDGLPPGYSFVSDAYTAPAGGGRRRRRRRRGGALPLRPGQLGRTTRRRRCPRQARRLDPRRGRQRQAAGRRGRRLPLRRRRQRSPRRRRRRRQLKGAEGKDRLTGGKGKDRLGGGPGNDVVVARDRRRDRRPLRCGPPRRRLGPIAGTGSSGCETMRYAGRPRAPRGCGARRARPR